MDVNITSLQEWQLLFKCRTFIRFSSERYWLLLCSTLSIKLRIFRSREQEHGYFRFYCVSRMFLLLLLIKETGCVIYNNEKPCITWCWEMSLSDDFFIYIFAQKNTTIQLKNILDSILRILERGKSVLILLNQCFLFFCFLFCMVA